MRLTFFRLYLHLTPLKMWPQLSGMKETTRRTRWSSRRCDSRSQKRDRRNFRGGKGNLSTVSEGKKQESGWGKQKVALGGNPYPLSKSPKLKLIKMQTQKGKKKKTEQTSKHRHRVSQGDSCKAGEFRKPSGKLVSGLFSYFTKGLGYWQRAQARKNI